MNRLKQRYIFQAWIIMLIVVIINIALKVTWADMISSGSVNHVVTTDYSVLYRFEDGVPIPTHTPTLTPVYHGTIISDIDYNITFTSVVAEYLEETTYSDCNPVSIIDSMPCNIDTSEMYALNISDTAGALGITEYEFELFSRVVEAESNRDPDDITGRLYIAATIWNRVNDERFPNTVSEVLCQSGQFSTVRGGQCSTSYSVLSQWAVVQAIDMLNNGEIPNNILFFNCIGYNAGTPFDRIGGNYFMCY